MDDQKQQGGDKVDDVMMPGFRFHPTDEELVAFYLKRKIQQRPLAIELIKQVDIYKYDPWDLSKMAATGEKEWYFYCPRDRKYRNSSRPNRVTGSGFWKATGTDRPIYTSDGTKCIGLKKSLVFYRGRAAKGIKTDWMMHEFRLPSTLDSSAPPKKILDKALPPNEAWAICRIFKKTNSIAQRALAHAWLAPFSESQPDIFPQTSTQYSPTLITSENVSCTTESGSSFSALNIPSSKPFDGAIGYKPSFFSSQNVDQYPSNFIFSQTEVTGPIYNHLSHNLLGEDVHNKVSENIDFDHTSQQHFNNFSMSSSPEIIQDVISIIDNEGLRKNQSDIDTTNDQWLNVSLMGFPFSWNPSHCPSESNSPASQVFN